MKHLTTLVLLTFGILLCKGQDTLELRNSKTKIIEFISADKEYVTFKRANDSTQSVFQIPLSEVAFVKRANGEIKEFNTITSFSGLQRSAMYYKGIADANKYYDRTDGAFFGTLLVSLASPLAGLVPAIACSATTPKEHNLEITNPENFTVPEYREGYKFAAKKKKQRKVWGAWVGALAVNFFFVTVVLAGQ